MWGVSIKKPVAANKKALESPQRVFKQASRGKIGIIY
jgi:hypothetical protein